MKIDRRLFFSFDWTLLGMVLLISGIGLLNIYSTGFSFKDAQMTPLYVKQAQWIAIGIIFMVITFSIDYRFVSRYAYFIYGASILLLIAVYLLGSEARGSQRWISLGGFFRLQPSELMKLTLIIALSKYFDEHKIAGLYRLKDLIIPSLITLVPFLLVMKQPDLGTALVLLIIFGSMVLFIGIHWKSLAITAISSIVLMPFTWFFLKDYQKDRILTFLNPESDPLGAGYHIIQSMIAIGSGGIFGKGFLKGTQTQLKFLPEQQTDFIFSVFAEEWGLIGGVVLVFLFLSLILWGLKIALHSRDYLGTLLSFGITIFIFWELFINMGMVLGIMPVVGIPLPFLSYGGSSMVVLMTSIGLLMNVSMRRYILQPKGNA
jgi:rod shape determining protein RodA